MNAGTFLAMSLAALLLCASTGVHTREKACEEAQWMPYQVIQRISKQYFIDSDWLTKQLGRVLIFGPLVEYDPLVAIYQIITRVFKDNECRNNFICKIGREMMESATNDGAIRENLDDSFLALVQGLDGEDCSLYKECYPHLNKEFREKSNLAWQPEEDHLHRNKGRGRFSSA